MAGGWTRDGAVQDQIDDTVKDAVLRARAELAAKTAGSAGASECEDCGDPIPKRRREALPGIRTCVGCQSERDARPVAGGINRRGSKDSQLR
jgi:phage/conjugal plasmid C-4 type zinc finger TraR family protein